MTDTPPPPSSEPAPAAPLTEAEDKQWGSFAHFGGIILGFLAPLIIWLIFKDRGPKANSEGKEALNFQITVAIGYIASFILNAILAFIPAIGLITILTSWALPLAIWVVALIFSIQGGMKVQNGGTYQYPFAIRFIK